MKKRMLIGILAASMTMSMGMTAFAAESTPSPETPVSSSTETYAAQKAVLLENARNYYKEKFNVTAYKKANPDLVPIYGDDENAYLEHYLTCGIYEGRRTGTGFDPIAYIINNFEFYMQNGLTSGNSFFNADEFMRWHPQIAADLNNDPAACLTWYLQYGVIKGVSSHAKFDVVEFAKKYPDAEAKSNITPDLALVADKVEQTNAIIKEKGYDYYINFYVDGTDKVNENIVVSHGSSSGSGSGTSSENTGTGAGSGTEQKPESGSGINNDYPSEWSSKNTNTNIRLSEKDSNNEAVSHIYSLGSAYILDLLTMNEEELNGFVENLLGSIDLVETQETSFYTSGEYTSYLDDVKPLEKNYNLVPQYDFERDEDGKAKTGEDGSYLYSDKVLSYTVYFPIANTQKHESYDESTGSHYETTYEYKDGVCTVHTKNTASDGECTEYDDSWECNTDLYGFSLYGEKSYSNMLDKLVEYNGANQYKKDLIFINEMYEVNKDENTATEPADNQSIKILAIDKDGKAEIEVVDDYYDIYISNPDEYRVVESTTEESSSESGEGTINETTEEPTTEETSSESGEGTTNETTEESTTEESSSEAGEGTTSETTEESSSEQGVEPASQSEVETE